MSSYRLDTCLGPVVVTQRDTNWLLVSPAGGREVYPGAIPYWCLRGAVPIDPEEAEALLRAEREAEARLAAPVGRRRPPTAAPEVTVTPRTWSPPPRRPSTRRRRAA